MDLVRWLISGASWSPRLWTLINSLFFCGLLSGCASWVAEILPIGTPVTAERCRQMEMRDFGLKDGREGRRSGERFEFWVADCKAFGVRLDRVRYNEGYQEGIAEYCSCEKGFSSGVRSELTEFRGQYYVCSQSDYGQFLKGYSAGGDYRSDARYVRPVSEIKSEYLESAIEEKAQLVCRDLPGNGTGGATRPSREFGP